MPPQEGYSIKSTASHSADFDTAAREMAHVADLRRRGMAGPKFGWRTGMGVKAFRVEIAHQRMRERLVIAARAKGDEVTGQVLREIRTATRPPWAVPWKITSCDVTKCYASSAYGNRIKDGRTDE